MGLLCPNLVAFFFDEQGNLNQKESRLWEYPATRRDGIYQIYDDAFRAALAQQKSRWKTEVGFQPGVIHIKQFYDEAHTVGIEILPEHYQDLETSDEFEDEEERQGWMQDRDAWLERGEFVWWWAKDYYMNAAGEVDST